MARGTAVIVGLRRVDPAFYDGSALAAGCWGAEEDVDRVVRLASARGLECAVLKTAGATAEAVMERLVRAARTVRAGDFFLFYFAGHGRRRSDESGDEDDGADELLLAFDRPIEDDELGALWREFPGGARILTIVDSCHSGTSYRLPAKAGKPAALSPMDASLIHFGASRDEEPASAYRRGGAFTLALCAELSGDFRGSYRDLFGAVSARLSDQHPRLELYGPGAEAFARERPFQVGEE